MFLYHLLLLFVVVVLWMRAHDDAKNNLICENAIA